MEVQVWSDVEVAVQSAIGSAIVLTALTKANPPVATSVGHGLVDGDVVLCRINGMHEVDYIVTEVNQLTADTFSLLGIDATDFSTFTSGSVYQLTLGTQASTITDVTPSGGEAEDIPVRTIHKSQDVSIPGNFSPIIFGMGSYWDPADPALVALKSYGRDKETVGIKIEFATGVRAYFAGMPSASMAPGGSAGAAVTTPIKINLRGDVTALAA